MASSNCSKDILYVNIVFLINFLINIAGPIVEIFESIKYVDGGTRSFEEGPRVFNSNHILLCGVCSSPSKHNEVTNILHFVCSLLHLTIIHMGLIFQYLL